LEAIGIFFYESQTFTFTKQVSICNSPLHKIFSHPAGPGLYMLYYKTIKFFECCEHKEVCVGVIADVYSPWECIQTDPFYSCNDILDECLRGVTLFLKEIPFLNLRLELEVWYHSPVLPLKRKKL